MTQMTSASLSFEFCKGGVESTHWEDSSRHLAFWGRVAGEGVW